MQKPNILFIMSDEHRADVTGFGGNSIIKTPTLDFLANSGTVFSNAYTPSPVCIPARQSMMAGQYPRTCKCERYGEDLTPNYMTFARWFAQRAYNTVACGKLHHMGTDQMQGWKQRIGDECTVGDDGIVGDVYIDDKIESEFEKYKKIKLKWSDSKEILKAGIGHGANQMRDDYTLLGAQNFIKRYFNDPYYDRVQSHRPLLLKVSFIQPHYPYIAEDAKFNYYLNRVNPYIEELPDHPQLSEHPVQIGKECITERDLRRATAAYYAMVEETDDRIRKLLDSLEEVGQNLDDWIIIYTSDHGEMLGQHGTWEKKKFYEASVKVPLIIRYPKKSNRKTVAKNVNLCDLFATLCDFVDFDCPDNIESRSLAPLMAGDEKGWINETVSQLSGKYIMIKHDDLKYQYYGESMSEVLFDLSANPEETINYINEPKYASAVGRFRTRKCELGF